MFFSSSYNEPSTELLQDPEAYNEAVFIAELMSLPDDEFDAIMESEGMRVLEEKGIYNRRTIVRLKKDDDLDRREMMAALQLAREGNDQLWSKLALNRVKERELLGKIKAKYGSRAAKVARTQQKDYIKMIRQGGTVKQTEADRERM